MHVLLVGSYPPPIGGNAVHVERLHRELVRRGHTVNVLDVYGGYGVRPDSVTVMPRNLVGMIRSLWRCRRMLSADSVVHVHVSALRRFRWFAPFLRCAFGTRRRIMTIHSGSFVAEMQSARGRVVARWIVGLFESIIVVSEEQALFLRRLRVPQAKLAVIPAFIPQAPVSGPLLAQVRAGAGDRSIVVTSGDLTRLYNHEVLVDCMEQLDPQRFYFVFAFYNKTDRDYEAQLLKRLERHENAQVVRDLEPGSFVGLLQVCDIYVRTATRDGDAVAVREALYLGKRVFASNCVMRPGECRTFDCSNSETLLPLFESTEVAEIIRGGRSNTGTDNVSRIEAIYRGGVETSGVRMDEARASRLVVQVD